MHFGFYRLLQSLPTLSNSVTSSCIEPLSFARDHRCRPSTKAHLCRCARATSKRPTAGASSRGSPWRRCRCDHNSPLNSSSVVPVSIMRFGPAFCRQTLHQSGVVTQVRKLRHPNIVNALKHATVINQVSTASKRGMPRCNPFCRALRCTLDSVMSSVSAVFGHRNCATHVAPPAAAAEPFAKVASIWAS